MENANAERRIPVLSSDGKIYCCPACGFDCLKSHYDMAVRKSNELAGRMGPGWETRVWENAGWHYSVKKGFCEISPLEVRNDEFDEEFGYRIIHYTAYFNIPGHQFIGSAASPEDAVGFVTQDARSVVSKIQNALLDLY